eukprot:jgi/Tetstr1/461532/TSEL_006638.t1
MLCPGRFRDPGTQLVGANGPPLHPASRWFCSARTQLVGAKGRHYTMCRDRLRGMRTHPIGAARPSMNHVPRRLCDLRTSWSAPTDRHCIVCLGRLRGAGTQLRPGTQLVDAMRPPLRHGPTPAASAAYARSGGSVPTGRHCIMCLGRFSNARTQLVGHAVGRPHLASTASIMRPGGFYGMDTQ